MNKTINIKLKELLLISSTLICLSCVNSSIENRKPVVPQSEIDSISNVDKHDDSTELYNAAIAKELGIKKAKDEKMM